jgi:hypothetical protein
MEKALATMPVQEKREVAEWLLRQIEDQIPKDFFLGRQEVREGRTLLMKEALLRPLCAGAGSLSPDRNWGADAHA